MLFPLLLLPLLPALREIGSSAIDYINTSSGSYSGEFPNLQHLGSIVGHLIGDMLELIDALTEVCDPLYDSQTSRHSVATPAPGDDA